VRSSSTSGTTMSRPMSCWPVQDIAAEARMTYSIGRRVRSAAPGQLGAAAEHQHAVAVPTQVHQGDTANQAGHQRHARRRIGPDPLRLVGGGDRGLGVTGQQRT
jgi:hypothetical protein